MPLQKRGSKKVTISLPPWVAEAAYLKVGTKGGFSRYITQLIENDLAGGGDDVGRGHIEHTVRETPGVYGSGKVLPRSAKNPGAGPGSKGAALP